MSLSGFFAKRQADIPALAKAHDVRGLIALLNHGNFDIQWHAADTLGTMGAEATPHLIKAMNHPSMNTRLGAVEALGAIKDTRVIEPLAALLASDETSALRWAAALALGEIGDNKSNLYLKKALRDEDRYVRYGAAKALEQLGWQPENEGERAYYLIAIQAWDGIKKLGEDSIEPLVSSLKEKNPAIRGMIIKLLGDISRVKAKTVCERVLSDPDERVRWKAILASRKCGISITHLPWYLSKRPKS